MHSLLYLCTQTLDILNKLHFVKSIGVLVLACLVLIESSRSAYGGIYLCRFHFTHVQFVQNKQSDIQIKKKEIGETVLYRCER